MLDFLETNPQLFLVAFIGVAVIVVLLFVIGGSKAESRFGSLKDQSIVFRERGASGYSTKSLIAQFGGATGVLDVVVTREELWIKGIWPAFTYIGTKYDLAHKVPLTNVKEAKLSGPEVSVTFTNESGIKTNVQLRLKDPGAFLRAVAA